MSNRLSNQNSVSVFMQGGPGTTTGATANGNGVLIETDGWNGAIMIEVVEISGGTATLTLQGTYDRIGTAAGAGSNWYNVGYQRVDGQNTVTRSAAAISVTATSKQVFQVLDLYPVMRAVISAIAGSGSIVVRAYLVPV